MPTALIQGRVATEHTDRLRSLVGSDWEVLEWDPRKQEEDAFAPMLVEADVVIGGKIPLDPWPAVPKLKLFQIPWTGYDFLKPDEIPAGVPVCNTFEHETSIAEYVLLAMLEWQIGLRNMDKGFRAHGWGGRGPGESLIHGEVRGRTVGIVGYGHIGAEVAKRAAAFDMRVIGVRRSTQPTPENLDWLGTTDRLDDLLAESDFVVIACDLNDETRNLINADRFSKMKPDGVIINVSRGAVVEEKALYEALSEKRIGGGVIDVWYNYMKPDEPEPWPTNYPFEKLDNLIASAHECGWTLEQVARRWAFVVSNIERAMRGEELKNVVFTGTQQG
ncbi:MAG: 2-hydroxyacid dehydrogenase [Pseudomonadota bacterium]